MKGHELKFEKGHYIPEIRGVVVYCYRQKQKHKKCEKCYIHLFHSRTAFPLYCFPVERVPDEIKDFEEKCKREDDVSEQMALHYKPEVKK